MTSLTRHTRALVAIAAVSLPVIVVAYVLAPRDGWARVLVAAALLLSGGVAIIALRFMYSLRSDRRYTALLENEVANQTRSLMDSLAATAAAERNLRLVMDAVPDAIVVVDRTPSPTRSWWSTVRVGSSSRTCRRSGWRRARDP